MRTPTGSRWAWDYYITRCHRRLGSVKSVQLQLETRCLRENQLAALSDPRLSSLARLRKKCCYGQKNFGSICSSLSPSPTHLSHINNINPFENKVWEVYFYKEVCSFIHWSRHYCWLCFCLYLCMFLPIVVLWIYNNGEAPIILELLVMQSTPSLPLLPVLLWPGVEAPDSSIWVK